MSTAYKGEWKENYIEGNGILRKLNEEFEIKAKFKKGKIVEEFKVLIKDHEIIGKCADENKIEI